MGQSYRRHGHTCAQPQDAMVRRRGGGGGEGEGREEEVLCSTVTIGSVHTS